MLAHHDRINVGRVGRRREASSKKDRLRLAEANAQQIWDCRVLSGRDLAKGCLVRLGRLAKFLDLGFEIPNASRKGDRDCGGDSYS